MNYLQALRAKNQELNEQLGRVEAQVLALKSYCLSDKFVGHENNYVNPSDIVLRIDNDILPELKEL